VILSRLFCLALTLSLGVLPAAGAVFTVIPSPDAAYLGSTTYLDLSHLADFATVTSVTDGALTLNFSTTMSKYTVPDTWNTWSSVPNSQRSPSGQLPVLYSLGETSIIMNLSRAVSVFGFEAEPDRYDWYTMTARFFDPSYTLLGSITLSVNGNAGARLFAASSSQISRVEFSCQGCDFAVGAFRYTADTTTAPPGTDVPIPEPDTVVSVGAGLAAVAIWRRRKGAGTQAGTKAE
jgi:hypothetical protein